MESIKTKYIEKIFRESNLSDELFDAFQLAISNKIYDIDLYKILLGNPALSKDEIKLFTEKLSGELKENCYDLYMWVGRVFENNTTDFTNIKNAFFYYQRASNERPLNYQPYLSMLNLYNYDIGLPINSSILREIETGVDLVSKKSKIYYALAKHYEKTGNKEFKRKYLGLAEKWASLENQ